MSTEMKLPVVSVETRGNKGKVVRYEAQSLPMFASEEEAMRTARVVAQAASALESQEAQCVAAWLVTNAMTQIKGSYTYLARKPDSKDPERRKAVKAIKGLIARSLNLPDSKLTGTLSTYVGEYLAYMGWLAKGDQPAPITVLDQSGKEVAYLPVSHVRRMSQEVKPEPQTDYLKKALDALEALGLHEVQQLQRAAEIKAGELSQALAEETSKAGSSADAYQKIADLKAAGEAA